MNVEQFRSAISTRIQAWAAQYADLEVGIAAGSLPVAYENTPQPEGVPVWVDVQLRFYSGNLMGPGRKDTRYTGVLALSAYIKDGEGTRVTDRILGSLSAQFRSKRIGPGAWFKAPEPTIPPPEFFGWHKAGVMLPFVLDEKESDLL